MEEDFAREETRTSNRDDLVASDRDRFLNFVLLGDKNKVNSKIMEKIVHTSLSFLNLDLKRKENHHAEIRQQNWGLKRL